MLSSSDFACRVLKSILSPVIKHCIKRFFLFITALKVNINLQQLILIRLELTVYLISDEIKFRQNHIFFFFIEDMINFILTRTIVIFGFEFNIRCLT